MEQGRREFLKRLFLIAVAVSAGRYFTRFAAGQEKKPARPPGTCSGYTDRNGDGVCDRSAPDGGCRNAACPANRMNSQWATAKAVGAPAGSCSQWQDPEKKGFCAVCVREKNPCLYTVCPAHKDHPTAK